MTDWPSDAEEEPGLDATVFLEQIEALQNSGDYDWASETLEGIHETVESSGVVTARQQTAVDNIEEGGRRRGR